MARLYAFLAVAILVHPVPALAQTIDADESENDNGTEDTPDDAVDGLGPPEDDTSTPEDSEGLTDEPLTDPPVTVEPEVSPGLDEAAHEDGAEPAPPPSSEPSDWRPGVLPAILAIVPGVAAHGLGHYTMGDPVTGNRLLLTEGISLVMGVGGVLGVALTGASRRTIGLLYSVSLLGGSGFILSWLADIYGAITGGHGAGTPQERAPLLEAHLGYRGIIDPLFDHDHVFGGGVTFRHDIVRVETRAQVAADSSNQRLRLNTATRLFRSQESAQGRGSYVDLHAGITYHNYGDDGFSMVTLELFPIGRLNLAEFSPTMRGAFAEIGLGIGLTLFDYEAPNLGLGADVNEMLLMRWAFGLYLGHDDDRKGEIRIFYDHRRDDYVGGVPLAGAPSGIVGYIGIDGHFWFSDRYGIGGELIYGSGLYGGLDFLARFGESS